MNQWLLIGLLLFQGLSISSPKREASVSGRLALDDGRTAGKVRVALVGPIEERPSLPETLSQIVLTDESGDYSFNDVAPGRYRLVAGPAAAFTYYPAGTDVSRAVVLNLGAGERRAGLDFVLSKDSLIALLLATDQPLVHHSFAKEYDRDRSERVTGELVAFAWRNPSVMLLVETKSADGSRTIWQCEGPGAELIRQGGLTRAVMNEIQQNSPHVTLNGYTSTDGSHKILADTLTTAAGTVFSFHAGTAK